MKIESKLYNPAAAKLRPRTPAAAKLRSRTPAGMPCSYYEHPNGAILALASQPHATRKELHAPHHPHAENTIQLLDDSLSLLRHPHHLKLLRTHRHHKAIPRLSDSPKNILRQNLLLFFKKLKQIASPPKSSHPWLPPQERKH